MLPLTSFEDKGELAQLSEVLQKAYVGIETLANGFKNNFMSLVQNYEGNTVLQNKLSQHYLGAVNDCLKTKELVFVSLNQITIIELDRYSLAGDALKLKLYLLNLKLLRLEKDYYDYSILSEAIDLMDAITDLLALLQKLSNLLVHLHPLIDILQIVQSLLKEISRV